MFCFICQEKRLCALVEILSGFKSRDLHNTLFRNSTLADNYSHRSGICGGLLERGLPPAGRNADTLLATAVLKFIVFKKKRF
jgi:hypothetical protein